jgi:uncharacterized glyoxalase superfamily protein PhnB
MADRSLAEQLDQAIDGLLAGTDLDRAVHAKVSGLTEVARGLREMPDERFKTRLIYALRDEFQRRTPVAASTSVEESNAAGFAAIYNITPFISVAEGDRLIEFMKHTFGAVETARHPHHGPDGFVAGMRIGDSDILIMGGESVRGAESKAALHVYVPDCDATYRRALEAGAVTLGSAGVGQPADRPYGERAAFVSDPVGNIWFIATRQGPDYVGAGLGHVTSNLLPSNAAPLTDFLTRAFGASVEGTHEEAGHMMHAFVRIGDAMVEMAEWEQGPGPFGFYLHTDDVDAVYRRAVDAGAISVLPPADQPFGDRLAIVQDPAGNRWFAAKRIVSG